MEIPLEGTPLKVHATVFLTIQDLDGDCVTICLQSEDSAPIEVTMKMHETKGISMDILGHGAKGEYVEVDPY